MTLIASSIHSRATEMKLPLPYQRCNVLLLVVIPSSSSSTIHQLTVFAAVGGRAAVMFLFVYKAFLNNILSLVPFPLNKSYTTHTYTEQGLCTTECSGPAFDKYDLITHIVQNVKYDLISHIPLIY